MVARLFCQDLIAGMLEHLEPGSIDVVITSPPYNQGIDYGVYQDHQTRCAYLEWCGAWAAGIKRVLAPAGSFFLNVGGRPTDPWLRHDVAREVGKHLELQNELVWIKSLSVDDGPCRGHVKPLPSACKRFVNQAHEAVYHFTHTGQVPIDRLGNGVPFADQANRTRGNRGANGDLRDRGSTWFIPYDTIQNRDRDRKHPAVFPLGLPLKCLKHHGVSQIKTVLDPFMGVGTTGRAAQRLGLEAFYGFDLNPDYVAYAQKQLELPHALTA